MIELENSDRDALVAAIRSTVSIVPGIGGPMAEILTRVIPGQRLDRVCTFLTELSVRIQDVEGLVRDNKYFSDLFEDSVHQAARALSESRNSAIATFLGKCTTVDLQSYEMKKKIFQILKELTDQDIEVLASYTSSDYMRLEQKFWHEIASNGEYERMSDEEKYEHDAALSLFDAHHEVLERFGLLLQQFEVIVDGPNNRIIPYINSSTGRSTTKGFRITALGRLLLSSISEQYVKR